MIYRCAVCNRTLVTRADEALEDGTFPDVVSWAAYVDDGTKADNPLGMYGPSSGYAQYAAQPMRGYACSQCVEAHDTPGKFEANRSTRATLGTALVLYAWSMDGAADDMMGDAAYQGYAERFGRFHLYQDASGFVQVESFESVADAIKEWDRLYLDGMGLSEFDAIISDDRGSYYVTMDGKELGSFERFNRARAAIRLEAAKTGYYPDAWHVGERGNVSHVNY